MLTTIYICAAGHSGSTLLDLLLGSHSSVESLGEIFQLPKNISLNSLCSCGEPVRSCIFWTQALNCLKNRCGADIVAKPYEFNLGYINPKVVKDSLHTRPGYRLKTKYFHALHLLQRSYGIDVLKYGLKPVYATISNAWRLYAVIAKVSGNRLLVDSSKASLRAIESYLMRPAEVKILLLTRDGRGVLFSQLKKQFPREKSILGWKKYYERSLKLLEKFVPSERRLHVKYEELVRHPRVELRRICTFLGIDFENAMLDFTAHPHHITNGNNMRFCQSSEIRGDFEWQTGLSAGDLLEFDRLAGDLNRRLGYS